MPLKDMLLITPPFTQLNTPYPATAYLQGFLKTKGISSFQMDLGIEVILRLFSRPGLEALFAAAIAKGSIASENAERIIALQDDYTGTIEGVIGFLQGKSQTLARYICADSFLPQAARFEEVDDLDWAFGHMGMQDKAKHLATLYLEDLSDFIVECVDPHFGFSRYAERLARSANQFDGLHERLQGEPSYIDTITLDILSDRLRDTSPRLVCFSLPFPGNVYSAFRCAQFIKAHHPNTRVAMGGGFPNTELRSLSDPRVFDYFDFVTLDDGELPIELLHASLATSAPSDAEFKRTFLRVGGEVRYLDSSSRADYKQADVGTPDYSDLLLDSYISVIQIANPMHSLWTDGRWNKLTMAHGCYWGKCTFCDVSLDYIKRYEQVSATMLVDRMEEMIAATGERGFHFVDEAAPPALMRAVAIEIMRRKLTVTWWTNIRFEKSFNKALCLLLKASGCIAVSGGLEVASNRLLALINKGVTVEQVARVTRHLTDAGIMVHAYLMYGYPTQTVQETIDSLEMVRQLFEAGILQSGFWHQFALTTHSPIGADPEAYGIVPEVQDISFAHNDVEFTDKTGIAHEAFSFGLKKSLYNFMHGVGFEFPLQEWFDFQVPKTLIRKRFIASCLASEDFPAAKPRTRPIWLGATPSLTLEGEEASGKRRGQELVRLTINDKTQCFEVDMPRAQGEWFADLLGKLSIHERNRLTFETIKADFESRFDDFESFWYAESVMGLIEEGLLLL